MVIGPAGSGKSTLLREGFPSDIIYTPESIRGVEYHPLITPRVGNQAVIFDVDGVLTSPPEGMICSTAACANTGWAG